MNKPGSEFDLNSLLAKPSEWLPELAKQHITDFYLTSKKEVIEVSVKQFGQIKMLGVLSLEHGSRLILRLKSACRMNITEARLPQDGRLELGELDTRLATHPSLYGECMSVRLLGSRSASPLEKLNLSNSALEQMHRLIELEQGLILISGPTGSGKTTLLHALIQSMGTRAGRVATLEDPVEIVNPAITQTDLSNSPGLSFAGGLRSLMRQDPDTLLIGEIRDQETAALCLQAALTGHRVFASIHAPDPLGTLSRLEEFRIQFNSMLSCLVGIVNLRLRFDQSAQPYLKVQCMNFQNIPRRELFATKTAAELDLLCEQYGACIQ